MKTSEYYLEERLEKLARILVLSSQKGERRMLGILTTYKVKLSKLWNLHNLREFVAWSLRSGEKPKNFFSNEEWMKNQNLWNRKENVNYI